MRSESLLTVRELMAEARLGNINYCEKTHRRILNKYLIRVAAVNGLTLSTENLRARQEFATRIMTEPSLMSWILFSDEKLVKLYPEGPRVAWKFPGRVSKRKTSPRSLRNS
jgi:hypothetical protein